MAYIVAFFATLLWICVDAKAAPANIPFTLEDVILNDVMPLIKALDDGHWMMVQRLDKWELIKMAKLAEQTKRYDEMVR